MKEAGHEVVGVDRELGSPSTLDRFVLGDLAHATVLDEALEGIDFIMHLAAAKADFGISDETFFFENVEVTRRLIAAARQRGIHKWIFYSSVAAIGPSDVPLNEEAPLAPTIAYGVSKLEAEALFEQYAREEPMMACITLRPSAVYGEENYDTTNIYRLIEAIHTNRFIMVGDGETKKTTSYIDNMIDVTLFVLDHMKPGLQTYIYVDDPVRSTRELVQDIYRLLGKKQGRKRLPLFLANTLAVSFDAIGYLTGINFPITRARIQKFCTGTNYDSSAVRGLGYVQRVSNEEAIETTVAWHLKHRSNGGDVVVK